MLLLILTVITSFAEIISLGAIFPFLTALINPNVAFNNANLRLFLELLSITSPEDLLFPLSITFALSALLAAEFLASSHRFDCVHSLG